jgi:uncharacterized paraquat-inducible protein A
MSPYNTHDPTDPEGPQEIDLVGQDDDDEVTQCPSCGKTLFEDAAVCPKCGHWIQEVSPAAHRAAGWFWPVMVAILIAIILVIWHGLR